MTPSPRWPLCALAAVLLSVASPGVVGGIAGLLVWPALAAFYAVATSSSRPRLAGYAIGFAFFLGFSWSLRHVTWVGYFGIAIIGAWYFWWVVVCTRARLGLRVPAALAFAITVAVTNWVRAHVWDIHYPHAQPAHSFYLWPALLGPVRWGGEVLANLLLAWIAAASVDVFRAWRVARPRGRPACVTLGALCALWILASVVPPPGAAPPAAAAPVSVIALEPGFEPRFQRHPNRFARQVTERLARPTMRLVNRPDRPAPALVVWPESSYPVLLADPPAVDWHVPVPRRTRLLAGSARRAGARRYATAILLDGSGRVVGSQDKIVPVPGGETVPFARFLPDAWEDALYRGMGVVGGRLDLQPGTQGAPLETAAGVPFSTLMCFDNAFDDVVRDAVGQGARFLCVLSNESWYHGGSELEQMVSMTVFRALETATPFIRCTVDGVTCLVRADGTVAARLAPREPGDRDLRVLEVEVVPGPGSLPPLAWLPRWLALVLLLTSLTTMAHALRSWARLATSDPGAGADASAVASARDHS